MITYEVSKADLKYVQSKLKGIEEKTPRVLKNAINHTAKTARKTLAAGAQNSYTVKSGGFNSRMKIENATAGRLYAVIHSAGKTLTIKRFRTTTPASGARADIVKTGLKQILGQKNIKAFKRKVRGKDQILQRETAKRYPINVLRSVSVPKMLEKVYKGERGIKGALDPVIKKTLHDEISAEIAKLV